VTRAERYALWSIRWAVAGLIAGIYGHGPEWVFAFGIMAVGTGALAIRAPATRRREPLARDR